jgi:site-specific DNA-methyltransferase (adenine-specific)
MPMDMEQTAENVAAEPRPDVLTLAAASAYYADENVALILGDCRELMGWGATAAVTLADPPYGETSLKWDRWQDGWVQAVRDHVQVGATLWCFGSFRMFLYHGGDFWPDWNFAQDVVWEKHNGSSFHADRFKRVHEYATQWYRGAWGQVYKDPQTTNDATARTVRRKTRPTHTGHIENAAYTSHDGGPKLARSVMYVRSEHGHAIHPTQKPLGILEPLIRYSTKPGELVFDPFAGSCSTLVAAAECGRKAIGIEGDEEMCEKAALRLSQGVLALEGSA